MKIEKDDFDKLKQLDRIEYRQIESRLKEKYEPISFGYVYTMLFVGVIGFLILYNQMHMNRFIYVMIFFAYAYLLLFFLELALNLIRSLKLKKDLDKLEKKYFNLNIK